MKTISYLRLLYPQIQNGEFLNKRSRDVYKTIFNLTKVLFKTKRRLQRHAECESVKNCQVNSPRIAVRVRHKRRLRPSDEPSHEEKRLWKIGVKAETEDTVASRDEQVYLLLRYFMLLECIKFFHRLSETQRFIRTCKKRRI